MTLAEFKAWFEGFTEDMDGAPSEKQWKRIKAKVKDIDGVALTRTVFVDRYLPSGPYWHQRLDCFGIGASAGGTAGFHAGKAGMPVIATNTGKNDFDGHGAMLELGKAEYAAALHG